MKWYDGIFGQMQALDKDMEDSESELATKREEGKAEGEGEGDHSQREHTDK